MTPAEQIKQAIAALVKIPMVVVMGTVVKIEDEVCTIKLTDGLELPDVRLKQNVNGTSNFLIRKPKKGSELTAISIDGSLSDLMMLESSEYESISYVQDEFEFKLDSVSKKMTLKNGQTNLYDLFQSLTDLIKQLTVSTPNGPSGTPLPPTISALTQFETEFKLLLNQ
jgi:hypothetical protein